MIFISNLFYQYLELGFTHVIPLGFDHILFILTLYLFSSDIKKTIIQCSVFTLAHSLSLSMSIFGLIIPNPEIIEPLIALTIVYTSIENIVFDKTNALRLVMIFFFGIIHGLGFASALNEIGLPNSNFVLALFSFNLGVELGQIAVILLAFMLFVKWLKEKTWYKKRVVYPISTLIGCIALIISIQRILDLV